MGRKKPIEFVYVSQKREYTEEEVQKALKVKEKVIRMLIDHYLQDYYKERQQELSQVMNSIKRKENGS